MAAGVVLMAMVVVSVVAETTVVPTVAVGAEAVHFLNRDLSALTVIRSVCKDNFSCFIPLPPTSPLHECEVNSIL